MKNVLLITLVILTVPFWANAQQTLGLEAGVMAPDFQAVSDSGETIKLSDHYNQGPVVLIFYRGGWCPFCNLQLNAYQEHYAKFKEYSAEILAVSVDKLEKAQESKQKNSLEYTLISNPDADLLKLYNIWYKVPDTTAEMYKVKHNIDLEAASGRKDYVIAIPATYVIEKGGHIAYAYVNEDYKIRAQPADVLKVLGAL